MFNKIACINANVSIDLSKISHGTVKKSYKNKIKSKLFRFNSLKLKSNNLATSTFVSHSKFPLINYHDNFSDHSDDSDSDISLTSLDDDLNSSLSSVSSLEFEPFECTNERRPEQRKKKLIVRKPMLHSSTSSIAQKVDQQKMSFEPCITSSRKSLLQTGNINKPECSVCHDSKISLENGSGYFSFSEEQICSSTHVSIDFRQNSTKNLSESIFTNSSVFSNSQFSDFYV